MNEKKLDLLKCEEFIKKAEEIQANFQFKSRLQVIESDVKYSTKTGRPFLVFQLKDTTGQVTCKRFIDTYNNETLEGLQKLFDVGNIFEVIAQFDVKWGYQIVDQRLLEEKEFDLNDFVPPSPLDVNALIELFNETINSINNQWLKKLLNAIFEDETLKVKYFECPSAVKYHHPYKFGNLEHTIGMIKIFNELKSFYNQDTMLDIDLILTCIILHDIGKIKEYFLNNRIPRKDQVYASIGHIILGDQLVVKCIEGIKAFPKDLENKIRHMILSHHGKKEWDSPVEPASSEAELLHHLDMIDSRFKAEFPRKLYE
ncbi:MAG: HD domain-containing protein [Candidatus Helarchaeota archaeon]|nr:HD domain-containing protein [Candidatus Helarchaeota archaeon]